MESENSFAGWKGTMRILGNTVQINPEIHSAGHYEKSSVSACRNHAESVQQPVL